MCVCFIWVLRRYNGRLRANDGRLMLAGVSDLVRDQLARTGILDELGSDCVFAVTDEIGGALKAAIDSARRDVHNNR